MNLIRSQRGQATVEYVLIFSFLFLIAIQLVRVISGVMETTSAKMATVLTQQLSSGYCEQNCFGQGYKNKDL